MLGKTYSQQYMNNNKNCIPKWFRLGLYTVAAASLVVGVSAQTALTLETKDKVKSYVGELKGSKFTDDGLGRTGKAGDRAIDLTQAGGPVYVKDASFLNAASANDEMTFAIWIKKYDMANSSAFWVNSPSSSGTARGWQAHTPWSNNSIYFDTAGCCDGSTQRISAATDTFAGYTGDPAWWSDWHFFVFTKKADLKRIWIDGQLFLEGSSTAVLPTDFTDMYIGANGAGIEMMHGLVDDFSIYATALEDAQVNSLFKGTLPTALPTTTKLVAYWDFNDFNPEGQFVSVSPTPDAKDAAPNLIQVVHMDGLIAWDSSNVSMKVDGTAVTPTLTRSGKTVTVSYVPSTLFAVQSQHTVELVYLDSTSKQQTLKWSFEVAAYTKDSVKSYIGAFRGGAAFSKDAVGHSGKAGDRAVDFSPVATGPVLIKSATFLNDAAKGDEMTFAIWVKYYNLVDTSIFWANAVSTDRGWQAHTPWAGSVYFDTAGCCDATTQRINAGIDTFAGYTGETSWWTNSWHFFVFTKKADLKRIWIDGQLFLEGSSTAVLPTDFVDLYLGSQNAGTTPIRGLLDDFSVYATALEEASVTSLYKGTVPSAMPATTKLLAYWNFDDMPATGMFSTISPASGATGASPNLIKVTHVDGAMPLDEKKAGMKVDGNAVTITATKTGDTITLSYVPSPLFAPNSKHTATVTYEGADFYTWQFTVGNYTKDSVRSAIGTLQGSAKFTADQGGKSGKAGDYAIDLGKTSSGQAVYVGDASFLNTAAASDTLTMTAWVKLYSTANNSLFWAVSPSSSGSSRGFQAHVPWGTSIYFDTAGCCDTATQRINAGIDTFTGYTGDANWWTNWHHFVLQKNTFTKEIWIDGELFLTGESTSPLPTDFTELYFGADPPDNARMQGIIDNVAVFGAPLDQSAITKLYSGTEATALPASTKLLAYFNFNDGAAPAVVPTISIARANGVITLTWTGTLQSATSLKGQWADVTNLTSPATITASDASRFYRAR